jgi:hypothetical protein
MMTRDEMAARKARIDTRLTELKVQLRAWKREAAAHGKFRPLKELHELEATIARLGQRSQRIQTALGDLRRADKQGSNAWFEAAARELLSHDLFMAICARARDLRLESLGAAGFVTSDTLMNDLELDDLDED